MIELLRILKTLNFEHCLSQWYNKEIFYQILLLISANNEKETELVA